MTNNVIRIKAMRKNWTVDEILEEAELDEETRAQAKEMEKKVHSDETVKRVQNHRRQRRRLSVSPIIYVGIVDMTVLINNVQQ